MRFAFLLRLFGGEDRIRRTVRATLRERSADPTWVTDDVVDGYMADGGRGAGETLDALRQMARAREPELLAHRLADVRCPVRLVIGDTPPPARGISDAEIELLAGRLAAFTIETVPHAGHFLFEEEPEAVAAAVHRTLVSTRPHSVVASQQAH